MRFDAEKVKVKNAGWQPFETQDAQALRLRGLCY